MREIVFIVFILYVLITNTVSKYTISTIICEIIRYREFLHILSCFFVLYIYYMFNNRLFKKYKIKFINNFVDSMIFFSKYKPRKILYKIFWLFIMIKTFIVKFVLKENDIGNCILAVYYFTANLAAFDLYI